MDRDTYAHRENASWVGGSSLRRPLVLFGLAVAGGCLAYALRERYRRDRHPARAEHPVTAVPDGQGMDPLDAPRPMAGPELGAERDIGPDPAAGVATGATTGAMTQHQVEENPWSSATPHVGSTDSPPRPAA